MSSSFPAARFPALPLGKEKDAADPVYKDRSASAVEASDEHLLSRIANEDREALSQLFGRYYGLVRGIAMRILRNAAEAEDLAQDVFLHIARKAELYSAEKGSARTWIVQLIYFQAFDRREHLKGRHYYKHLTLEERDAKELSDDRRPPYDYSGEAIFGKVRWQQISAMLTDDQWETIRLHFFEGWTLSEIGRNRNQTLGNVRHHFYRGLARLRKYLFHDEVRNC